MLKTERKLKYFLIFKSRADSPEKFLVLQQLQHSLGFISCHIWAPNSSGLPKGFCSCCCWNSLGDAKAGQAGRASGLVLPSHGCISAPFVSAGKSSAPSEAKRCCVATGSFSKCQNPRGSSNPSLSGGAGPAVLPLFVVVPLPAGTRLDFGGTLPWQPIPGCSGPDFQAGRGWVFAALPLAR